MIILNQEIQYNNVNEGGYIFTDFYVCKDHGLSPGWFIFGRNKVKYGIHDDGKGAYVMLCARPSVKPRKHPHYNGKVKRGWHTKKEAQAICDELNLMLKKG